MRLTSATKLLLCLLFLFLNDVVWSQSNPEPDKEGLNEIEKTKSKKHAKFSFIVKYNSVQAVGDKYVGLAYNGKSGYGFTFKSFLYKGVFLGVSTNTSFFENENTTITGNYNKTRLNSYYLITGYEHQISKRIAIGASIGFIGESRFKNEFTGLGNFKQIDKANVSAFEAYLNFYFTSQLSLNVSYTYRNDKTKIETSPNLESTFNRAQFSLIGLGLNFQFGNKSLFSD